MTTLPRGSRAALFEQAVCETERASGVPRAVFLPVLNPKGRDARRLLVAKLPSMNLVDIAKLTGWHTRTVSRLRALGKTDDSGQARQLTRDCLRVVQWIIGYTLMKHKRTMEHIKYSSAGDEARWEIIGRLMHQMKMNEGTARCALGHFGIKPVSDDFHQGFALLLDGRSFGDRRRASGKLDRAVARGKRRPSIVPDIGSVDVPGCSSSMALVMEAA